MSRGGQDQQRSSAEKAKLDSKGRPIATKAPKADPRKDGATPVRAVVRMGAFLLLCSTQTACKDEPVEVPGRSPEALSVQAALADARSVLDDARTEVANAVGASLRAQEAAKLAIESARVCVELAKIGAPKRGRK